MQQFATSTCTTFMMRQLIPARLFRKKTHPVFPPVFSRFLVGFVPLCQRRFTIFQQATRKLQASICPSAPTWRERARNGKPSKGWRDGPAPRDRTGPFFFDFDRADGSGLFRRFRIEKIVKIRHDPNFRSEMVD